MFDCSNFRNKHGVTFSKCRGDVFIDMGLRNDAKVIFHEVMAVFHYVIGVFRFEL